MRRRYRPRKKPLYKKPFFYKSLALFISFGALIYLFYFAPFLKIQKIEFKSPKDLEGKFNAYLPLGKNFFLVSTSKIKDKILKVFPEVEKLEIKKIFPNKIIFEVKKREPFGILYFEEKTYFVDGKGFVFEEKEDQVSKPDLVFRTSEIKPILGRPILKEEVFEGIKEIIDVLNKNEIKINEIILEEDKITFVCQNTPKLYFSNDSAVLSEGKVLYYFFEKYFKELSPKEYIDFRFSSQENGRIYFK
jgi:cell division septal protein FtsQ